MYISTALQLGGILCTLNITITTTNSNQIPHITVQSSENLFYITCMEARRYRIGERLLDRLLLWDNLTPKYPTADSQPSKET